MIFNTGPYGEPHLKIKILKIGLRHVLSWPKLGLEPKFHEAGLEKRALLGRSLMIG